MQTYISVGVSAGKIGAFEKKYVIFHDQLYGLPDISYLIWASFRHTSQFSHVINQFNSDLYETAELSFKELLTIGLVIPLEKAILATPIHQGEGAGLDEKTGRYIVFCGEPVSLSYLAFVIWCYSDGKSDLKAIAAIMKNQGLTFTNEMLIRSYVELLKTDAILLA